MEEPSQRTAVLAQQRAETPVVGMAEACGPRGGLLPAPGRTRFHQHGTEGWAHRQGTERGDGHGHCHRQTELTVVGSAEATHECSGDEHAHEDNSGGDDGVGDTVHSLVRGSLGGCRGVFQLLLYGLHHHDGIVDHGADDQHQGKEGDEIERETHEIHEGKGTHQRDHDAHGGNDGGAPVLQEEQHHNDDEQQGFDQRLVHRFHRGIEEVVGVQQYHELQPRWQMRLQFLHQAVYLVVHLLGVGSGGRGDDGNGAIVGIDPAVAGIAHGTQFHTCHVTQPQVVGTIGLDDDILELLLVLQTSPVHQRVLVGALGILTQSADGSLHVLSTQGVDDVFRIQLVLRHLLRVHPDTHAVDFAHQLDIAHTGYALQTWLHVDIEIVGDEGIVVAVVGALQGNDAQHALLLLLHLHAQIEHLRGQVALGLLHTVLDADLCQVWVGSRSESNVDGGHAAAGGRRGDILHAFHTVDGLLKGCDHTFHHRLGTGSGVLRADGDNGRSNVWKLLHGQTEITHDASQQNEHREGTGEDRTCDKETTDHDCSPPFFSFFSVTSIPSVTNPAPSAMMTSPGARPAVTTKFWPSS